MKDKITRSQFLKRSAVATAGLTALGLGAGILVPKSAKASPMAQWPFPYTRLDPEDVRVRAHDAFWSGYACSYGVFHGIVSALREEVGSPFTDFPTEVMIYGHGGGAGWGVTCGTINGGSALISLVCEKADSDPLVSELFGWYTQTSFPSDESAAMAKDHIYGTNKYDGDLIKSVANSPQCHVSVSKWCDAAKIAVGDVKRKERCARLAGDVAAKTVEILNAHFSGTFTPAYTNPSEVTECLACHSGSGVMADVATLQACTTCHGESPHTTTTGIIQPSANDGGINLKQNYPNPFSGKTNIDFELPQSGNVTIEIFDLNGQHIKTLVSNRKMNAGNHQLNWDGRDEYGQSVASGMYLFRLKSGRFVKTMNMLKEKY